MTDQIIPPATRLAALRGFVRTATQALASVIPITAITIPTTGDALLGIGLGVAGGVASALLAGAASFFLILSQGIPEAYTAAGIEKIEQDTGERAAFLNRAQYREYLQRLADDADEYGGGSRSPRAGSDD